jgi:hypothetical protein
MKSKQHVDPALICLLLKNVDFFIFCNDMVAKLAIAFQQSLKCSLKNPICKAGVLPTVVSPGAIWTEIEPCFHIEFEAAVWVDVLPDQPCERARRSVGISPSFSTEKVRLAARPIRKCVQRKDQFSGTDLERFLPISAARAVAGSAHLKLFFWSVVTCPVH